MTFFKFSWTKSPKNGPKERFFSLWGMKAQRIVFASNNFFYSEKILFCILGCNYHN